MWESVYFIGKGTEPLAIAKVTPEYLCQCGNETITVTLNTNSEKNGKIWRYISLLLLNFVC